MKRGASNRQTRAQDQTEITLDNEAEGASSPQNSFIEVVQLLLDNQRREKEEERARWEQQQEILRRDKEVEKKRADEEWTLRLQELKLRTEALKRSEEIAAQARAESAERDERKRLQKRAEKLEPWRDSDLPEAYFSKFERTMREAHIPQKEWPSRLISLLTGKALTAYHRNVPQAETLSYSDLKEALMDALGLSHQQCRRTFWSFTRKPGETPQETVRRIETIYDRMVHNCKTEQEYRWEMVTGRYLSTYSSEVADYVRIREPKTTIEMANLVQQYFDGKQVWSDQSVTVPQQTS